MVKKIAEKFLTNWKLSDSKPVVVEKYDKVAVKNGIDDLMKSVFLNKYNVTENFKVKDTRLSICFLACLFSLAGVVYDYLHPFPESKVVLGICSCSYFAITGILYVWEKLCEKGIFFQGYLGDKHITVASNLPGFSGEYTLTGDCETPEGTKTVLFTKCVSTWIDQEGTIVPDLIEKEVDELFINLCKSKEQ